MKKIKYTLLVLFFYMASSLQELYAENEPPPPKGGFDDCCVVGDVPIDSHVLILFFAAMLLGVWFVNKMHKQEYTK